MSKIENFPRYKVLENFPNYKLILCEPNSHRIDEEMKYVERAIEKNERVLIVCNERKTLEFVKRLSEGKNQKERDKLFELVKFHKIYMFLSLDYISEIVKEFEPLLIVIDDLFDFVKEIEDIKDNEEYKMEDVINKSFELMEKYFPGILCVAPILVKRGYFDDECIKNENKKEGNKQNPIIIWDKKDPAVDSEKEYSDSKNRLEELTFLNKILGNYYDEIGYDEFDDEFDEEEEHSESYNKIVNEIEKAKDIVNKLIEETKIILQEKEVETHKDKNRKIIEGIVNKLYESPEDNCAVIQTKYFEIQDMPIELIKLIKFTDKYGRVQFKYEVSGFTENSSETLKELDNIEEYILNGTILGVINS